MNPHSQMTKEEIEAWKNLGVGETLTKAGVVKWQEICDLALKGLSDGPAGDDTRRLDWLQSHRASIYKQEGGSYWVVVDEKAVTRKGCLGKTLREAIDCARPVATERGGKP